MNTDKKIWVFFAVSFVLMWLCKNLPSNKKNEISVGGFMINKNPCVSLLNEFYGKGVDSNKACECYIPAFYSIIKNDPKELEIFKEYGLHTLDSQRNQILIPIFEKCITTNIIDTNYKLQTTGFFRSVFIERIKSEMKSNKVFDNTNIDSFANCVADRLNNSLTIKQYYEADSLTMEKIQKMISACVESK